MNPRLRILPVLVSVGFATLSHAGTTGQINLHMPQAENASRPFGDWVSDNDAGALNTFYRYFIEVPPGVSRVRVQIFDADVGQGGANEDDAGRDRDRTGGYTSNAVYSLLDPNGTAQVTRFTTGNATGPVLNGVNADNNWLDLYNGTANNVLDTFATAVYTRNDGNNNWSSNWTEANDDGSAAAGQILVTAGELRIGNGTGTLKSIYRQADLQGTPGLNMGMAFLTFSYRTSNNLDAGDTLVAEVSSNGGGAYTTLETFTDDSTGTRSYDVTGFISDSFRVRFRVTAGYNEGTPNNEFFFADNVQISDGPITAGHWEFRVDMTQGTQGDDINALGIRADDGNTAGGAGGGTELNVYADSMVSLGVNPDPGANSRTFSLHPWVTSGCSCSQNDFDMDSNSGDIGSATYTSPSGAVSGFTQTFTAATLSADNVWNRDNTARFNNDNSSNEYGTWTLAATINTYAGPSGNYETTYVGSELSPANPPVSNPILSGGNPGTFRLYLPDDAGNRPVKPYLEQFVTKSSGSPSLPVSTPTTFTVSIRMENPTAFPITFNGSNLVTANVPGGAAGNNAVYAGGAGASQGAGTITAPAIGGTGNITWNPGTLAAGGTALLSYNVTVTATAGNRIVVTATPGSGNGTRAQYIDETANATQARARFVVGPICEVAVTHGLATAAVVSSFTLDVRGGATTVDWKTASEAGTIGFNVYRTNGERVNRRLIPASLKPQGGTYQLIDTGNLDPNAAYWIEEVTSRGEGRRYGPFNHLEGVDREKRQEERRAARSFTSEAASRGVETEAKMATAVAVMVGVPSTGLVRVPFADLAGVLQTTEGAIVAAVAKGGISVTNSGTPVAWTSDGRNVLFFGQKTTSIYSNDRVYRIELANGVKMPVVPVIGGPAAVSSFTASQEIESDAFAATVLPLDPESDYWYWEAFISGDADSGRRTFDVTVPAVASASGATLLVRLQGAFKDGSHHAKIALNGVPIGETTWKSFAAGTAKIRIPDAVLRDGANQIAVEGVLDNGERADIFYLDGFSISYQKLARPESGQIEVNSTGSVGAGPFASAPMVLDITNRTRPSILQGGAFSNGISSVVTPPKTRALFFADAVVTPSFLRGSAEARLKTNLSTDWLIVVPPGFRAAGESLANLRVRDGLRTYVADLNQIYDEFAGGNSTPLAIRDFFTAQLSMRKGPRYFVLAGVGTVDYRGIEVSPGPLPPMMTSTPDGLYASDSLFVDGNGDRLPDAAIGRIPVATPSELSAYVSKLEANEGIDASHSPMVFSADAADQGANFRQDSILAESTLTTRPATHVYLDDVGSSAARTSLLKAWRTGTTLVSWVGHGGLDQLSNAAVLSAYDTPDLPSTGRLPVLVAMTCTINRFENGYVDSLGTALTKEKGAGAVAVWSASGLSLHSQAGEIQRTFLRLAGQTPGTRVGDLVVAALARHGNDTSSVYLLLGDPAIRLDLPAELRIGGGQPRGE